MDLALQVLRRVRWQPECAQAEVIDVRRTSPPKTGKGGSMFAGKDAEYKMGTRNGRSFQRIEVFATVMCLDRMGIPVCILKQESGPINWSVTVHGAAIAPRTSACLEEIFVAHATQAPEQWGT